MTQLTRKPSCLKRRVLTSAFFYFLFSDFLFLLHRLHFSIIRFSAKPSLLVELEECSATCESETVRCDFTTGVKCRLTLALLALLSEITVCFSSFNLADCGWARRTNFQFHLPPKKLFPISGRGGGTLTKPISTVVRFRTRLGRLSL